MANINRIPIWSKIPRGPVVLLAGTSPIEPQIRHIAAAFGLLVLAAPAALAQTPSPVLPLYPYESIFRQDPTGEGSFHRLGMFRSQKKAIDQAAQLTGSDDTTAESEDKTPTSVVKFTDNFSGQFRANTMLFASNNIFNTENNQIEDGQLAEFAGASIKWDIFEHLSLNTTYDAAFFFHGKSENSDSDFTTSTVRQQLAYERFFLNNKASFSVPVSWQYSDVFQGQAGDRLVGTFTYATGIEFSAFPTSWFIPSISYTYLYSDPDAGSGKHKHDFNLGATFIPFKDVPFYVIPSVQYSHEDFHDGGRKDNAWTPTLTLSWSPLKFLAFDAVASYTDSSSNIKGSSFDAVTTTVFARLFLNW